MNFDQGTIIIIQSIAATANAKRLSKNLGQSINFTRTSSEAGNRDLEITKTGYHRIGIKDGLQHIEHKGVESEFHPTSSKAIFIEVEQD